MTKIYLIKATFYKKHYVDFEQVNLAVYTNKKLAKAYLEYKKITKEHWLDTYEDVYYEIEEFYIQKIDWSKKLLEKQMEELPY